MAKKNKIAPEELPLVKEAVAQPSLIKEGDDVLYYDITHDDLINNPQYNQQHNPDAQDIPVIAPTNEDTEPKEKVCSICGDTLKKGGVLLKNHDKVRFPFFEYMRVVCLKCAKPELRQHVMDTYKRCGVQV